MERTTDYRILVAGLALLVLVLAVYGIIVPGGAGEGEQPTVAETDLIEPVENGSLLWPYTSRSESVDDRTLALNIIVYHEHDRVEERFRRDTAIQWDDQPFSNGDPDDETDIIPEEIRGLLWRDAHGSDRYVYVESAGGEGEWLPESYQLYEGRYLGERHHIRAYESPDPAERWVAMQAHEEYFDYFRLRHTVTSTNTAQRYIESEFLEDESVLVSQEFFGNVGGSDSDGWVTLIDFLAILFGAGLLGSIPSVRRRLDRRSNRLLDPVDRYRLRGLLLAVTVIGLYVGVRVVGIALEQQVRTVNPQLFAGMLYPVLAIGIPLAAYFAARPLRMDDAFLVGAGALSVAVLVDFALVGIVSVPRQIILHRIMLALSLGLIAAAAAFRTRGGTRINQLLVYGVFGWLAGLLLTLLGFI